MNFDNPTLKAAFEENKIYLENRLKILEDINRDIGQLQDNLKALSTPPNEKTIEELGTIKWDGKELKLNKKKLESCQPEVKLKIHSHLKDFLIFVLKGEL